MPLDQVDVAVVAGGEVDERDAAVENKAELIGICNDYAERSERPGVPALLASRRLGDE